MEKETYNAREVGSEALALAKKTYPDTFISDARFYNYKEQMVVAVAYKKQRLPYTSAFLSCGKFMKKILSFGSQIVLINLNTYCFECKDKNIPLSSSLEKRAKMIISEFNEYGGYINARGEHVIDLSTPRVGPHFDVNLLLGHYEDAEYPLLATPKSVVNSFGGGSFRGEADFQVSATKWGVNPYENGNPFNRQFYLVEKGKQIFFSGKMDESIKKATCIHSSNYTTITYFFNKLKVTRKIFILGKRTGDPEAVEIQEISIENLSSHPRHLQLIAVGMFGFSNPDCQKVDIIYQTVINQTRLFINDQKEIEAISPDYYPKIFRNRMRFALLRNDDGYADSFTNDLEEFLGGGTYAKPRGLNNFSNNLKRSGASFYALKKSFDLPSLSKVNFSDVIGASYIKNKNDDIVDKLENDINNFVNHYPKFADLEACFQNDQKKFKRYAKFMELDSPDQKFNAYTNATLPFQVWYQSFVSRGFAQTQKGYREIGFREIQDLFASMYYMFNSGQQHLVKRMLASWIENVYEFGYANHNFYYRGKEPGICSDDQLWLIQAIYRYVKLSGDYEFLSENFKMAGSNKKRKLYETLKSIITYSAKISIGKHGLPLLDFCDWNDCLKIDDDYLDGPTKEKKYLRYLKRTKKEFGSPFISEYSESVMNGFLLVVALREMKEIAYECRDEGYGAQLKEMIDEKTEALQNSAYIKGYFARVLINRDNENHVAYIGSKGDGLSLDPSVDGSYYLNSFSWSLLSRVAEIDQIISMLDILEKHLKTPAGFVLCTNSDLSIAGSKQAATDHYFPGDRENGGVFKHAAMMAVVSMLKQAKIVKKQVVRNRLLDNAFYMLDLVLPYKTLANPYILKGNPRFCTQYNNSQSQENIGPILSGTASWLTLAIYEIVGLEFEKDQIKLSPSLPKAWEKFKVTLDLNETIIEIQIFKKKNEYINDDHLKLTVDGQLNPSMSIPRFNDKKRHLILVKTK